MKTFVCLFSAILLTISLAACSGTNKSNDVRVKCPACGYEFDTETKG